MVSPVAPGGFKIATSPDGEADLSDSNVGTPYEFVVLSASAPMLTGISGDPDAYNMGAAMDMAEAAELVPRDNTSKEYDNIHNWFSDPDDIFLTYSAMVDKVERCDADADATQAGCQDADGNTDKRKLVDVATATIDGNKLTVALNKNAKMDSSDTAVWCSPMTLLANTPESRLM